MPDMRSANFPTIKAFNAINAIAPSASGISAAAFSFNNSKRGSKIFLAFFFLPRAEKIKPIKSSIK